jgi:hypothetical protein
VQDDLTRDIEEHYIDFVETQLDLVGRLGLELYARRHLGKMGGDSEDRSPHLCGLLLALRVVYRMEKVGKSTFPRFCIAPANSVNPQPFPVLVRMLRPCYIPQKSLRLSAMRAPFAQLFGKCLRMTHPLPTLCIAEATRPVSNRGMC